MFQHYALSSYALTPNRPTNIVGFRGFDSSTILIQRGGIPRPIGDLPESSSRAMLVGTMLVGGLGVCPYLCTHNYIGIIIMIIIIRTILIIQIIRVIIIITMIINITILIIHKIKIIIVLIIVIMDIIIIIIIIIILTSAFYFYMNFIIQNLLYNEHLF